MNKILKNFYNDNEKLLLIINFNSLVFMFDNTALYFI